MRKRNSPREFSLIRDFFLGQPVKRDDTLLGIGDDAALVAVPPGQNLVVTTDTLVAGTHFFENVGAYDIGHKALAVNLSDLAAMGATPSWFTLALTMPTVNEQWLEDFCQGLFALASAYQVQLIGGDLTEGPLSITVQALGHVDGKKALRRDHAAVGDLIYVTHTVGDGALGLLLLKKEVAVPIEYQNEILACLHRPLPQIEIGKKLLGIAHAAIDISDGLAADLRHILEKSGKGAEINVENLPLSAELKGSVSLEQAWELALAGGDDYELCFTVPANKTHLLDFDCTCIGKIVEKEGLYLQDGAGRKYNLEKEGYRHF